MSFNQADENRKLALAARRVTGRLVSMGVDLWAADEPLASLQSIRKPDEDEMMFMLMTIYLFSRWILPVVRWLAWQLKRTKVALLKLTHARN